MQPIFRFSYCFVLLSALATQACGTSSSNPQPETKPPSAVVPPAVLPPTTGDAQPVPTTPMLPTDPAMPQDPPVPSTDTAALDLVNYSSWNPVLSGDVAFQSKGHGVLVKSYLNPTAANHANTSATPFPMPVGSVLAKAVIPNATTASTNASRVYFMTKKAPGFDSANGDWSYAVANRVDGKLVYDSLSPRAQVCVSCHVKFKSFDFVQTVDFYKKQSVN